MSVKIGIKGSPIRVLEEREPAHLSWKELGVDIVIESTGRFANGDAARAHISTGAKKVIISGPAAGADATFVLGINERPTVRQGTRSSPTRPAPPTVWPCWPG